MTSEYDIPSPACCLDFVLWLVFPKPTTRRAVITEMRLLHGFEQGLIQLEKKLPDGIGPEQANAFEVDLEKIAYDHAVDAAFKQWFPQGRRGHPKESKYFLDLHRRHPGQDRDYKSTWTLYRWTPRQKQKKQKNEKRD